jgi:phosphoglucosamine mutase
MRLFGTDGIRGRAGVAPLDPKTVARIGASLARARETSTHPFRVLIGRDTRESGLWIEQALATGLTSEGAQVVSTGVVPTPAVAYLTATGGFDAGVVISASHNPFEDNGIKVFSPSGEKLSERTEKRIESLVHDDTWPTPQGHPRSFLHHDLSATYEAHLLNLLPETTRLRGTRIVVDCAHGATAVLAPALLRRLGFEVDAIGVAPDGRNINHHCGSTYLGPLQRRVVEIGAALGIAFDGDGDRTLLVDERGHVVDGDALLLILADDLQRHGRLPGQAVVATIMSNIGLELALRARGIRLERCAVGDKYVMETMRQQGLALGGEQSGHVIVAEHLMTGDGLGTALQVLRVLETTGASLSSLASALVAYPQTLVNVRVRERADLRTVPAVAAAMARVEARLNGRGRLLVRYSGTEPLLRIMLEGQQQDEIAAWAEEIAAEVRTHLS